MSEYRPDRWLLVKISKDGNTIYRVFGTWYGGYLSGASWRFNSGIVKVKDLDKVFVFVGNTGSEYICNKEVYGASGYTSAIIEGYQTRFPKEIEIMSEEKAFEWAIEQSK